MASNRQASPSFPSSPTADNVDVSNDGSVNTAVDSPAPAQSDVDTNED